MQYYKATDPCNGEDLVFLEVETEPSGCHDARPTNCCSLKL